jgi:hypothetical protein
VKEFVFGALDTSLSGHVAVTSASSKGKRDAVDVAHAPGAEVTLICDSIKPHKVFGSLLEGGGDAKRRPAGAPSRELRALLRKRTDRAYALIDGLRGPLREAASTVRTQLELRASRKIADLSKLTPEQDLLAETAAVTLGEPGLCNSTRPDNSREDNRRLVRLALQHAFGMEPEEVELLAPLFAASGHGLHALMRPADGSDAMLRALLERIDSQRAFIAALVELIRGNGGREYAPWLVTLLESGWNRAARVADPCADLIAEGALAASDFADALNAPASVKLPYDDAGVRAAARLLDAGANRLFLLVESRGFRWPGDAGVSKKFTDRTAHLERATKADTAYNSDHALVLLLRLTLDEAGSRDKDMPSAHLALRIQQAQRKAGKTPATLATPKQIVAEAEKRKVRLPDDLVLRMEEDK